MRDVLEYPDKPWNWHNLSCNPSITMRDVLDHPDMPWNWNFLSFNPNITRQDVLDYPDKPWDWFYLSNKNNITMRDVLDHPDKPWVVEGLAANPSVMRPMTDEIVDYVRKRHAALIISSAAFEAWSNPNCDLCRRRLRREFDLLYNQLNCVARGALTQRAPLYKTSKTSNYNSFITCSSHTRPDLTTQGSGGILQ